jgi:hypothetical protein
MKNLLISVVFVLISACHTQASRVRCDLKLQPINVPAPIVKESPTTRASTP